MMADLNSLMIFATLIEAGSFSEAARRLNIPVSTVSRRIAEIENQLGVRLLERSTRNLRLTEIGAEILDHAQRSLEVKSALDNIVSNKSPTIAGQLRLAAPPSISDTLLLPLIDAFQASYPDIRAHVFVTDRIVDQIAEGIDLAFRVGPIKDPSLSVLKVLTYRHQLLASPTYVERHPAPHTPGDLLRHRLLAFSFWTPEKTWSFAHINGKDRDTVTFLPSLTINDYAGLTPAMIEGVGIGELPPVVQPELVRNGRLVEVMPDWRFPTVDLSIVHQSDRQIPRQVRLFKDFALQMAPKLFPALPT